MADLQKSWEDNTDISCIAHISILRNCGTFIQTSKYYTISWNTDVIQISPMFALMFIFLLHDPIQDTKLPLIIMS